MSVTDEGLTVFSTMYSLSWGKPDHSVSPVISNGISQRMVTCLKLNTLMHLVWFLTCLAKLKTFLCDSCRRHRWGRDCGGAITGNLPSGDSVRWLSDPG